MNTGKICVSICAAGAAELIEAVTDAAPFADIIELRFDCLAPNELTAALEKIRRLKTEKTLLLTFRPAEQGGKRELTVKERELFWRSGYDFSAHWADVETDLIGTIPPRSFEKIICSYHDFEGVPPNLDEIYNRLSATAADVLKIAVQAGDITDTIAVWKLLEKSKLDRREIVPIAIGEAGKWTRILGLAHGAPFTYAALEAGKETAPGQISAKDLNEVYRVRELNEETEVYGILGNNTRVSLSPYIHNAAFKFHDLNAVFIPLQVNDLDEFMRRLVKPATREINLNFKGFAVTIPHKQAIIKHLDHLDETAKKIGAVNTVKIVDGKLHGFNTDAHGFIEPLKNCYGDLKNVAVAVLGAGGAARACVYALQKEAAKVTVFARDLVKAKSLADDFQVNLKPFETASTTADVYQDFDILVNTTPLGMRGKAENETPAVANQLKNLHLVYDLIYVPFTTRLMTEAARAEVPVIGGTAMLIAQAMEQQKIWNGLDAPMQEMSRAALSRLQP